MMYIRLVRTDEDAEEVNISLGEAVIGRGELLGCTDKRVSRKHCMITLSEDGKVILKAVRNSVVLNDGDEFALLPDSYQFRVTVLPEVEAQCEQNSCAKTDLPSDSVKIKEEAKEPELMETESVKEAEPLPVDLPVKQDQDNGMEVENEIEDIDTSMDQSSGFSSRIRILPSWMTDSDANEAGSSKTPGGRKRSDKGKNDKAVVNKKARVSTKKVKDIADDVSDDEDIVKRNKNVTRGKLHELSDDDDSDTGETKKTPAKGNRGGRKRNNTPKKAVKQKTKGGKDNAADVSDGETSDNPQVQSDVGKNEDNKQDMDEDSSEETNETKPKLHELSDGEAETVSADTTKQDDLPAVQNNSDDDQSNDTSNNTATQNGTASNSRQKCLKNPQHRIDFSHPGDIDYDDNDLPECPYGTACYRKNKQHRLDYKHTAAPQQGNRPQTSKDEVGLSIFNSYVTVNCNSCNLCNMVDRNAANNDGDYDYDNEL
ncbi:hypothetical protein C0J52_20653 [Blattella germanica]|nr:hypothetical protein C0J52_20653 [Blattella germanica]